MKLITLSDHAADQQDQEREGRQKRYGDALAAWKAAAESRRQAVDRHRGDFSAAVRQLRPLLAIGSLLKWVGAVLQPEPSQPVLDLPSEQERRWASGQEGEQRVRSCLEGMLGDDWTVVAGYRNRGGEMDLLVLGPSALVAVEVKYLNGVVHCRGQDWTLDKYDKYGNLVEQGLPVRDRKGRAPNRQVNESANALETFLASRGQRVKVKRAVVLAHEASRLGEVSDPGVDFVGALASRDFKSQLQTLLVGKVEHPTAGFDVAAIVGLVQKDHAYHARRIAGQNVAPAEGRPKAATPKATAEQPVLLPERIVAPLSAGNVAMSPLALRQLEALVSDIRILAASNGTDEQCRDRVRRAVSGHLMSGARWTVLSGSQGTLRPGPERNLLQQMIRACRQSFDFEDRTLCAVVAPLAVKLQSVVHAGQGVDEGAADMLSLPSLIMSSVWGAKKVAFGARFYAAKDLYYADARMLRDLLLQIEAGSQPAQSEIKSQVVHAAADPEWQVVYLLGVAVMAPGESIAVDEEQVQRETMSLRPQMVGAFAGIKRVAFNREVRAEAVSEGFWSLDAGVRKGELLRRRHALERVLMDFHESRAEIGLWYAEDRIDSCVRLLVGSPSQAADFKWDLLVGESTDGFKESLASAAALHLPLAASRQGQELDLYALEVKAKELGLSWLGT